MFFMLIKNTDLAKGTRGLIVALPLEAEEAFDQVEWEFMFQVLKKMKFGDKLVNWIWTSFQAHWTEMFQILLIWKKPIAIALLIPTFL